ncbi:hypothetical protein CDV31_010940 [Fusarium ambrosium]|uniref:Uncharacterized protein n=1 Tax=Fusarium ambrosium TaxID=131363 RepID=A0A428TK62_9HYPO|nr:hypothetical protein CDV31_010940 [Fusarium ambrosium]
MSPPSLVTIDASQPLDKINEIIARDGGVIVSNFLPRDVLDKAMQDGEPPPQPIFHSTVDSNYSRPILLQLSSTLPAARGFR